MPCYRPLDAWQLDDGKIVFRELKDAKRSLRLPCGKCVGCYLERSRQWAVRCMHEAQMHPEGNSFVTLTFADEHLPADGSLRHSVFQAFAKRTRKRLGPFRFFMCGEYGAENNRPHYHACLFGLSFADREFFKTGPGGTPLYTSDTLSSLWPYGFASVGDVTFESAAYVARYVVKKAGRDSEDTYLRHDDYGVAFWVEPEYARMSNRPGIGASWWRKYGQEVLQRGNVVMRGVEMKPPRYYAKLCKDPAYDWVEQKGINLLKQEDNTLDRLAVREIVAEAALAFKKREI